MTSAGEIIMQYVCPTLGCIMATIMFAAPVRDLKDALREGDLGSLNPFPWTMMTGNTLGWVVYGYYTADPFVVAANLPGLVLSIWLNSGASKLQYMSMYDDRKRHLLAHAHHRWDADAAPNNDTADVAGGGGGGGGNNGGLDDIDNHRVREDDLMFVPQERSLIRVLVVWSVIIVYVGWFRGLVSSSYGSTDAAAATVGIAVNLNLIFFYGAPLQTVAEVVRTRSCDSIHLPTMVMNWCNTSFWIAYGFARRDVVIILPNAIGLFLGLLQGALCLLYPRTTNAARSGLEPLRQDDDDDDEVQRRREGMSDREDDEEEQRRMESDGNGNNEEEPIVPVSSSSIS